MAFHGGEQGERSMKWSNWMAGVVMALASAELALSQAPTPSETKSERAMTLHENGKSIRCRIISTWQTPEGAKAYQLQALDTDEMITIVADGQASTIKGATASKATSLPTRIYHWGRS